MPKAKLLEIVATDGARAVRLIWFRIGSNGGIYGSFFHPSIAIHRSYHTDGTIHWKTDSPLVNVRDSEKMFKESGYSRDVDSGPPLSTFAGYFSFLQGIFRLDPDCFETLLPYDYNEADRLIILDARAIRGEQRHVNIYLDLIEAGSYVLLTSQMAEKQRIFTNAGMICEHHCYLEFEPWVLVSIAYSSQ